MHLYILNACAFYKHFCRFLFYKPETQHIEMFRSSVDGTQHDGVIDLDNEYIL